MKIVSKMLSSVLEGIEVNSVVLLLIVNNDTKNCLVARAIPGWVWWPCWLVKGNVGMGVWGWG